MSPISTSLPISGLPLVTSGAKAASGGGEVLPNLFSLPIGDPATGEAGAGSLEETSPQVSTTPSSGKVLPAASGNGLPSLAAGPIAPNNARASAPVGTGAIDSLVAGISEITGSQDLAFPGVQGDLGATPAELNTPTGEASARTGLLPDPAAGLPFAGQPPADPALVNPPATRAPGDPAGNPTDAASGVAIPLVSLLKERPTASAAPSLEPQPTEEAAAKPKDSRPVPTLPAQGPTPSSAGSLAQPVQPSAATPPPGPAGPLPGPVPGDSPAIPRHEFAQVVERLAEAREWARPGRAEMHLAHREFGPVSLQFEISGHALKVALSSPHSGFVAAAQAAMAEQPRSDSGAQRQDSAAPFHSHQSGQSANTDAQAQRHQGQTPYRRDRAEGEPSTRPKHDEQAPRRTGAGDLFA